MLAKGVKRVVRPGPARRGGAGRADPRAWQQSGDGFLSGHAAIAAALAAGVMPLVPGLDPVLVGAGRDGRRSPGSTSVRTSRSTSLGGAALGIIVDAAIELALPS